MKFLIMIFSILLANAAFAGSNTSTITCSSDSGKTHFFAKSWDMWTKAIEVEFAIEGDKLIWENGSMIYAAKEGVFTVVAGVETDADSWVTFWSMPKTAKTTVSDIGTRTKFRAKVEGSDPRQDKWGQISPVIELNCEMIYER